MTIKRLGGWLCGMLVAGAVASACGSISQSLPGTGGSGGGSAGATGAAGHGGTAGTIGSMAGSFGGGTTGTAGSAGGATGTAGNAGGGTTGTGGINTGGRSGAGGALGTGGRGVASHQNVSAGNVVKSSNYRMVFTLGQPTPQQTTTTSAKYKMRGGLIGATGTPP